MLAKHFMQRMARKLGRPAARSRPDTLAKLRCARLARKHPRAAEHDRACADLVDGRGDHDRLAASGLPQGRRPQSHPGAVTTAAWSGTAVAGGSTRGRADQGPRWSRWSASTS